MIVGMDVDDVVADLTTEWLKRYNQRTKDNLHPVHIRDWNIAGYAKKMSVQDFYGILHEPDLYGSVLPHQGAQKMVEDIKANGHRVVFITACVGNTAGAKKDWLIHHGFMNRGDHWDFIAAHDKSLITGVDVLVDDRIENVENFPKKALLVRRPHNEDLPCWRARAKVYEVADILEYL